MITTKWSFGDGDLSDCHLIRRAVFIGEQNIAERDEIDGTDGSCAHLVAYDESGRPAATGRIMVTNADFVIGRVAVLPEYRRQGYGTLVMKTLIRACCLMGGRRQKIHSQLTARGFYEKLGFKPVGAVFDEAGIPHIEMVRDGDCEPGCAGGLCPYEDQTGKI